MATANATAPGPGSSLPSPPPDSANATDILKPGCNVGDVTCLGTQVTDNQIVTALWVSCLVGVVSLLFFSAMRGRIKTYHTRLDLASVWIMPPRLPMGGIHHLWSWLYPLFTTSDAELIHTAGLDALMLSWTCSLGIQVFLPLTILGSVILLPVNMGGNRVNEENSGNQRAATSTFTKLTVSNIARGSAKYWVVFAFVYIVTIYICWLLVKYYQAYVVLRQHYLTGGENLINEWSIQFLAQKEAEASEAKSSPASSALQVIRNIFDPASQMGTIVEEIEEAASILSGHPGPRGEGICTSKAGSQFGGRDNASMASAQSRPMSLSAALRRRRLGDRDRSVSPPRSRRSLGHVSPQSLEAPTSQSSQTARISISIPDPAGDSAAASRPMSPRESAAPTPQEMGHRRRGSELTREVLEAAGLAPEHDAEQRDVGAGEVVHEPVILNPGGGGLRSALRGRFRRRSRGDSRESGLGAPPQEEEEHVTGRRPRKSVRFLSQSFGSLGSLGRSKSGNLLKKQDERSDSLDHVLEMERAASMPSTLSGENVAEARPVGPGVISKYERNAPSDQGRERIHRWWLPAESAEEGPRMGAILSGKPNVSFRKIVNTTLEEGRTVGVNAQQYAVLVMDVPDLSKERMKSAKRAKRHRWWWRVWYRFVAFCKRNLFLRKNIDRRTGDLVLPVPPVTAARPSRQSSDVENGVQSKQANGINGSKPPVLELTELHLQQDSISPNETVVWPNEAPGSTPMPRDLVDKPRHKSGNPFQDVQPQDPEGSIKASGGGDGKRRSAEEARDPKSPKSDHDAKSPTGETADDLMSEEQEEYEVSSETLVAETFRALFPDSFDGVLPVRKHKAVDLLLMEWNKAWHKLLAAETEYERSGCTKRPEGKLGCCGCTGKRVDKIDFWAAEVRRLEKAVVEQRKAAMESAARTSFFVFFTSQKDAAIAAQTNLHPEDGHSFRVKEAPGPEEVNWQALWMTWGERDFRGVVTLIPLLILLLFPIGLFSGSVNQATVAVCGGSSKFFNKFYSTWYCKKSSLARSFVTGVLPSVLLMLWQNLVMPTAVYRIAQQQGSSPSMSHLDRRIGVIFFVWDVFNVFLGAMLGGSIFSQLGLFINNPGSIPKNIGAALPTASNFFVNYIIIQAFATQTVRLLIPHLGIFPELFRLCGCCRPQSELQKMEALSVHSIRYGREMGNLMLIFLMAATYSATSPIILPFTLLYFAFAWIHWRYNILYISERCYESGGRMWDLVFRCIVWILFIFELFTGFVLLANSAFAQASILWVTMTPMLYKFSQYCEVRYERAVRHMPLETAALAPNARVPAVVYLPPALRRGAAGWYPEFGKAWENFGMPTYSW